MILRDDLTRCKRFFLLSKQIKMMTQITVHNNKKKRHVLNIK